jgi:CheY-like chemotaxis protein/HPt (histidine-containing phosphotransfer) domain-containing protein
MFALFSQGKEGGGKAGLGLYFCRTTVERWGGTIGCESLAKKGARFWFRLPRAKAQESSDQKAESPSVESLPMKKTYTPRSSLQILFADDQEDIRTVTAFRLQQSGYIVSLASNGEAALQASRQQRFHVILLDEEMPLMNGVEVVRAIRQDYAAEKERPIFIAVTGNNTPEDVERLIEAGFDSVIGKPFRLEALQKRLQELSQSAGKSIANPTTENRDGQFAGSEENSVNLLERMGGDLRLLGRVASTFLRDLPARMSAVQIAIERNDARALAQSAHALKGSAGIFGASAVRKHAQSLEDFGKKNELSGVVAAFAALKEEIANLEENLRGYAQQTGAKPSSKPRKGSRQTNSGKHST